MQMYGGVEIQIYAFLTLASYWYWLIIKSVADGWDSFFSSSIMYDPLHIT